MRSRYPEVPVRYVQSDFSRPLDLPLLDGVIMANALHFTREKDPVLKLIRGYLGRDSRMILVEYNVDRGNMWVPYPLSYSRFESLAPQVGLQRPRLLAAHPSSFLREIYSAEARA